MFVTFVRKHCKYLLCVRLYTRGKFALYTPFVPRGFSGRIQRKHLPRVIWRRTVVCSYVTHGSNLSCAHALSCWLLFVAAAAVVVVVDTFVNAVTKTKTAQRRCTVVKRELVKKLKPQKINKK